LLLPTAGNFPILATMLQNQITAETVRNALLARIDAYKLASGKSDSAIGKEALNDDKFVKRIRDGNGFNVNTLQKVIDWIDAQDTTAPAMERAS